MAAITIVGPTGSGKSKLAIELASKFNGEIICADSLTIYRGMDIGAAKHSKQERELTTHYGLDLIDLDQNYSVAQFKKYATNCIDKIQKKDKLPIIVGGSGLYIDAVLFDYKFRKPRKNIEFKLSIMSNL